MARGNSYPFWTHDTVAAAVLAGVGAASFQIKLDALASEWKIPAITACVHAWPMLLIFAGVVMLLVQPVAGRWGGTGAESEREGGVGAGKRF
jgi:hypothetical protein